MLNDLVLLLFLSLSAFTDLRFRKVYNWAVAPALAAGLALHLYSRGIPGLFDSLLGMGAGFLFLFLFYLLGVIGAGDVKFLAAVGSIKGAGFVLTGGVYGAVVGGLAAITVLAAQKRFLSTLREIGQAVLVFVSARSPQSLKLDKQENRVYLPYTVFLSAGMLARLIEIQLRGQ